MPSGRSGGSRTPSSARGSMSSSRTPSSSRGSFSSPSPSRSAPPPPPPRPGMGHRPPPPPPHRPAVVVNVGGGHRPPPPRHRHRGHYSAGSRNSMSAVGAFGVIAFIVAIVGIILMSGANSTMKQVKIDTAYYASMAQKANAGTYTDYIVINDAKFTVAEPNDKGGKWWMKYEFTLSGAKEYGATFPIYTESAALALEGTTFSLAVYVTEKDSVPLAFKDAKPEDDGDYIGAESTKSLGLWLAIIGGVICVLCILAGLGMFKFLRRNKGQEATASVDGGSSTQTESKPSQPTCAYCGARIGAGDIKCSTCGATIK